MKGIDKGDVVSSGAPQISKDNSLGRNLVDLQSRRAKLGTKQIKVCFVLSCLVLSCFVSFVVVY